MSFLEDGLPAWYGQIELACSNAAVWTAVGVEQPESHALASLLETRI